MMRAMPSIIDPVQIAASGPRACGRAAAYTGLLRLIGAGAALHYPAAGEADDESLLEGDASYARGLVALAELGDLEAVGQLADVISLLAQAQLSSERELAAAIWDAGAIAVGWGGDADLEQAKSRARADESGAVEALLDWARGRAR